MHKVYLSKSFLERPPAKCIRSMATHIQWSNSNGHFLNLFSTPKPDKNRWEFLAHSQSMCPSLDDKSAIVCRSAGAEKAMEKTNGSPPKGTWSCNCFDNHRCKASKVQASQVLEIWTNFNRSREQWNPQLNLFCRTSGLKIAGFNPL